MKSYGALFLVFILSWAYASNFYDNNPYIMELTPKSFDRVIQRTNYTTLVEFYAPWCGYCQKLKRPMEKLAKSADGLVQVAAVNCDLAKNKRLCAEQLVQHFPTLVVYRPPKYDLAKQTPKKSSPHLPEVYKGERSVRPMLDFCLSRIKTYVQSWSSADKLSDIINDQRQTNLSALLISKKTKISASYKSIAIDWLGIIDFHYITSSKLQNSEKLTLPSHPNIEKFLKSLSEFHYKESTLIVFDKEADTYYVYDGESFTKQDISVFLAQYAKPREGPLSKRGEYIMHLKSGSKPSKRKKETSQHDEL